MFFCWIVLCFVFFFKQKTAYEMRISDWSSDVCSSDLPDEAEEEDRQRHQEGQPLTAAPEAPEEHARDDRGQQRHLRGDENARRDEPAVPIVIGKERRRRAHRRQRDQRCDAEPEGEAPRKIGSASCRDRGCQYV